jgi:hypothetical protein
MDRHEVGLQVAGLLAAALADAGSVLQEAMGDAGRHEVCIFPPHGLIVKNRGIIRRNG